MGTLGTPCQVPLCVCVGHTVAGGPGSRGDVHRGNGRVSSLNDDGRLTNGVGKLMKVTTATNCAVCHALGFYHTV